MAYVPINWQTGDTITAEKMNKMDNGWSVESGTQTIYNESVTTEDDQGENVAYLDIGVGGAIITAETIVVTFDGTEYTCDKNGDTYGGTGYDFSVYPFMLYDDGTLYTESAGTYTVKIEIVELSVETSSSFESAISSVLPFMQIVTSKTTWQEVYDALEGGAIVTVVYVDSVVNGCTVYFATSAYEADGSYYVTLASVYETQTTVSTIRYSASSASGALEPAL